MRATLVLNDITWFHISYGDAMEKRNERTRDERAINGVAPSRALIRGNLIPPHRRDSMEQREQPHPMQSTAQIAPSTPIDTIENDQALREAFATIYDLCAQIIPEGRYKSLVMTGLEIAQMWAIKAIHHTPR